MLSPEEFTVGSFKSAAPGSLILPRNKHESVALICEGDGAPVAVFLAGEYAFRSIPSGDADNWNGLIILNVDIEADENSLYDPDSNGHAPGALVREQTTLIIRSQAGHSLGRSVPVVVKSGLPEGKGSAGFTRWQVVIGQGDEKRVLHKIDLAEAAKE